MSDEVEIILPTIGPGRRAYTEPSIIESWTAKALVEVLEDCGGDIDEFLTRFYPHPDRRQLFLTHVFLKLSQPENVEHWLRWDHVIGSFRRAKLALAEHQALSAIQKMPQPDEDTKLSDWLAYVRFWASDKTIELRESGKAANAARSQVDVMPPQAMEQLQQLKAAALNIKQADKVTREERELLERAEELARRNRPPSDYYGD